MELPLSFPLNIWVYISPISHIGYHYQSNLCLVSFSFIPITLLLLLLLLVSGGVVT